MAMVTVRTSEAAAELVKDMLSQFDREVFCILNLASDGKPREIVTVSLFYGMEML